MAKRYFGTDGIRGQANGPKMTPELAMKVGQAAGHLALRGERKHRVLIGKDTRLSGYMLEQALTAGFTSVGMDVVQVGPMPTPAVALLTRELRADLGVMLSASHNPFHDNGIKLFGPDGFKLSDAQEEAIEALIARGVELAGPAAIGRARRIDDASGRYIHAVKSSFPENLRLDGLRVVVDCAHGAAYRVAPDVLWELGADIISIGVQPNGTNINAGVGSTHPDALAALSNPASEINSHFSLPPFVNRALQDKNVHVVLQSNDVVGGPVSNGVVFSSRRFVDANPKLVKAFIAALDDAMAMIKNEPLRAAEIYIAMTKERFSPDALVKEITAPGVVYATAPQNTMKIAEHMIKSGVLKTKPASWKDYFFAAVHDQPGA